MTQSTTDSRPANPLKGRAQWLTVPGSFANVAVGAVLVYYCGQTMDLPAGTFGTLSLIVTGIAAVLVPLAYFVYYRATRTLSALGKGRLPLIPEHLAQAARETHRFSDVQFWVVSALWCFGAGGATPFLHMLGYPDALLRRIVFNAYLLAPLGSLLTYLLCVLRTRRLLKILTGLGLGADGLIKAIPPAKQRMRIRLMVFTAILVVCPAVISADLALSMLGQGMDRLREVHTAAEKAQVASEAVEAALTAVLVLGGMLLAFALTIAYTAGSAVGGPLQALAREAKRLATADRAEVQVVPAEDELWAVSCAFQSLHRQTAEVLERLQAAGSRIAATTETLVQVAQGSEDGTSMQATALGATSATTEELARTAELIAHSAEEVAVTARKTLEASTVGQANSRAFLEATERLRRDNGDISTAVNALRERVQRISKIVEFINGVADRADLLALNAELEGTKAGEIGRGFSLVAGEMRRVAEQVVRSTREIEALIADVIAAAQQAAEASDEGQKGTRHGAELALELSEMMERIHALSRETADAAASISLATGQQRAGASELAQAMSSVLRVTEIDVTTTREMAMASSGLSELARALESAMTRFDAPAAALSVAPEAGR